jgi:hypothetical protein
MMPIQNSRSSTHLAQNEIQLASASIRASNYKNNSFDELALAKELNEDHLTLRRELSNGIYPAFLSVIKKKKINCPNCSHEQEIVVGITKCIICSTPFDYNKISLFRVDVDYSEASKVLQNGLIAHIKRNQFEITKEENDYFVAQHSNGTNFSVSFNINPTVQSYYELAGHSVEDNSKVMLLIGFNIQNQLSVWTSNKAEVISINYSDFIEKFDLKKELTDRIILIDNSTVIKEKFLGNSCQALATDFGQDLDELYGNLPRLALSGTDGTKFESDVITVLEMTIFNIMPLGNQNSPDGVILINKPGSALKSVAVPFDVKSYKGKPEEKIDLTQYYPQFRKYIEAFKSAEIQSKYLVPSFVIIAYDFDLTDQIQKDRLKKIENDFSIRFVLLPLESLIYLAKKYLELGIFNINPDFLINFFNQTNYVTKADIDQLLEKIVKLNKLERTAFAGLVRENVRTSGF